MAFHNNRELAAQAGRNSMAKKTPDELARHQSRAANALLMQRGAGYFAALGRKSAALRASKSVSPAVVTV